jgi:hypothetical protein
VISPPMQATRTPGQGNHEESPQRAKSYADSDSIIHAQPASKLSTEINTRLGHRPMVAKSEDGENVPKVLDCETEDGWIYTNPNGPYDTLELCGTWCDMVSQAQLIKAEYFCNAN